MSRDKDSTNRQKEMNRISQSYNEKKASDYKRKGGREAKYRKTSDGSYVFDGYK